MNKMKWLLPLFAIMMLLAFPTMAQENTRTVTVTGTGIVYGAPDNANVEVGVDIADADFGEAFSQANSVINDVLEAIEALGIAPEDIQTTSINVWWEDEYDRQSGMPTGVIKYHVSQSMRILVRDITQIDDVITTAVDNGANQIYGLYFGLSNTDELESEARAKAVENARAKAQELAELMDVELGEVVSILEYGQGMPIPFGGRGGGGGGFDTAQALSVSPGQLSVTTGVEITFAIE